MDTESTNSDFSPQESLQLIRSMIEKVRFDAADRSHHFLIWGWLVFSICIIQYVLLVGFHSPYHYYTWQLIWVGLIIMVINKRRMRKTEKTVSYIGDAMKYIWTAFGISCFVVAGVCSMQGWIHAFPTYITLYAIGTFVSGSLIRFRPLVVGAVCCWIIALVAAYSRYDQQILLTALALLLSYIIPGHLLRLKYRR